MTLIWLIIWSCNDYPSLIVNNDPTGWLTALIIIAILELF